MLLASTHSMSSIITQGHSSCQVYIPAFIMFMPTSIKKQTYLIILVKVKITEHIKNTVGYPYQKINLKLFFLKKI